MVRPDGSVALAVWDANINDSINSFGYNDGEWHHVVATVSTTDGQRLYLDGAEVESDPAGDRFAMNGYWRFGGQGILYFWNAAV
jgi:large repetitive protein